MLYKLSLLFGIKNMNLLLYPPNKKAEKIHKQYDFVEICPFYYLN